MCQVLTYQSDPLRPYMARSALNIVGVELLSITPIQQRTNCRTSCGLVSQVGASRTPIRSMPAIRAEANCFLDQRNGSQVLASKLSSLMSARLIGR